MQRQQMTEALISELIGDLDRIGDTLVAFGERWATYADRIGDEADQSQVIRLMEAHERFNGRLEECIRRVSGE